MYAQLLRPIQLRKMERNDGCRNTRLSLWQEHVCAAREDSVQCARTDAHAICQYVCGHDTAVAKQLGD